MDTSYCIRSIPVISEMILKGIVAMRPKRAILTLSSQLSSTKVYCLNCCQGWETHELVRRYRNWTACPQAALPRADCSAWCATQTYQ
eukprot:6193956-Pleurochrysis_carterae.AAC.2